MKKNILILLILIGFASCSNGQNKQATKDYSSEIIGCWQLYDARHEIKSDSKIFDSLALEDRKLYIISEIKNPYITKFFSDNITQTYHYDGKSEGYIDYYKINADSLTIQGTVRSDDKSTSKISINNDTLYLETNVFKEVKRIYAHLRWGGDAKITDDVKIEVAKRYATFIRVYDCDQYEE